MQTVVDFPLYVFHHGKNYRAYDFFGAHPSKEDGKHGYRFRVWAPHAVEVSVVGDFNDWDPEADKMERLLDGETWTAQGDPRARIERHEAWYHYVMEELTPRIYQITGSREKLMTTGCSMGAFHAANFFFRRPDVIDTVVALSGMYQADYFFGDYSDELVYLNSPVDCLANLPADHPYMDLYRRSRMIFCVGQGAWEEELLASTRRLEAVLREKSIPAWVDYWGTDVCHDWPWWYKQMNYFLGHLLP